MRANAPILLDQPEGSQMGNRRLVLVGILLPRLEDVLFLAMFLAVIGLGPRLLNVDGDLGRHLVIGEYILNSKQIPTQDLFSHTRPGAALTPHEWLAQCVFAIVHRPAALDGVLIGCALIIAITFRLVYRQCQHRSGWILGSVAITLLAAAVSSLHWLARPHLFTLLLTVIWVGELEKWRTECKLRWWVLPVLMLVWANMHGAFVIGFVLWGIYLVGEYLSVFRNQLLFTSNQLQMTSESLSERKKWLTLLGSGLAAIAVSFANPAGWRLWETSLGFLRNHYLVSHTAEYLPPNFQSSSIWPFILMIMVSILTLGIGRPRLSVTHILLLTAWTAMGLYSARNIPLYAVIAAPILTDASVQMMMRPRTRSQLTSLNDRLNAMEKQLQGHLWPVLVVMLVVLALVSGVNLDIAGRGNQFDPVIFPVEAVEWLEGQPPLGRSFNYFPWGGYLLYRLWPDQRVFIDGQTDFYGEELTREYEKVITLQPGWQEVLKDYKVDWVIMPAESGLVKALINQPGWVTRYRDTTAVILFYDR